MDHSSMIFFVFQERDVKEFLGHPPALAPEMSQLASLKAVSRVLTKNLLGSNSFID